MACSHQDTPTGLNQVFFADPNILNSIYNTEALNDVFISNFQKDPTLTWQYFGSSYGFFRIYPGTYIQVQTVRLLFVFSLSALEILFNFLFLAFLHDIFLSYLFLSICI